MKSIQEVLAMPDGTVVEAVGGLLTVTGPRQNKTREDCTTYSTQPFTLSHDGQQIHGVAYDQMPLDPYHCQQMVMASLKSRNGRFGGVKVARGPGRSSLFVRKPTPAILHVSHAAGVHTPDTYQFLCENTKRPTS